jgi:hypothetical protein
MKTGDRRSSVFFFFARRIGGHLSTEFHRYEQMMKPAAYLSRVTISLPADLAQTLLSLRLSHAVSVSAIAETAIRSFLNAHQPDDLKSALKAHGAGLRRRSA